MWINSFHLINTRCFKDTGEIVLSRGINIFIGRNNQGKSTILRALHCVQDGHGITGDFLRKGSNEGKILLRIGKKETECLFLKWNKLFSVDRLQANLAYVIQPDGIGKRVNVDNPLENTQLPYIPAVEPKNFIYPFLSKRKVASMDEGVNTDRVCSVRGDLQHLPAKVDRICNPEHSNYNEYKEACLETLGFMVTTSASNRGKKAGMVVSQNEFISLDAMGEGVTSLIGLIVMLATAKNHLFIIEEPENDIHPKALKALLRLIVKSAESNQFIISTHSNIVARQLGVETSTKLFQVSYAFEDKIPTSCCKEVGKDPEARREVLEELGYELSDYNLWKGWLFLEESSAERLIREYFLRWYTPSLVGKLRTFAAGGDTKIEPKFSHFNELFVFTHLETSYKNRAWVLIDDGERGKEIVKKFHEKYGAIGWGEKQFKTLKYENFENYYPENISVDEVLKLPNSQERQYKKIQLLNQVISWIDENEERAKEHFETKADDIIVVLKDIEKTLQPGES